MIPETEVRYIQLHSYPVTKYNHSLTLCHSYLNPYCLGRKTAFFSVGI
jgi:hypothetical protein